MLQAITRRFKRGKRGTSTVIVAMLSLVLVVIIVGNVVLWSYQMNQVDMDRMQETLSLTNVMRITRSQWFTAQTEFSISAGSRLSGTFTETKVLDSSYETFKEERTQIFHPSSYVLGGSTSYVSGSIADLDSNDDAYMNFRSYPNYEVSYQESLVASSTTSTTYQDKVSVSFTPQVTADFVIIAVAEVQGSSTSYQAKARLTVGSTTYQELAYRVKDTTDWYPFSGLKRLTLNGGTNYEIKIQFSTNNAAGTARIRNAELIILSLPSEYAESEALSTTSNTIWEDKTTLTFTPPSNGDYLVIATANYRGSSASYNVFTRLVQDGTIIHADTSGRPGSGTTANYYTFGVMRKVTLDTSQHNFKIQYCSSSSSGIAGINYAHIVAIKLSQFDSVPYAEDEIESSPPVVGQWTDKVVNTYTADSSDYLMLGSISYRSGSTSYSVGIDFQTESTSRQSPLVEHRNANDYESAFFMTKQTLTAGSKTDKIGWMGESTNARVKNARLISCKLPLLTQTVEVEPYGSANIQNWTQLEWTTDLSFTTPDVTTTLQLYNYNASQYPTSGDGYITDTIGQTDTTKNQTITATPTHFRDTNGNWRIKIKGTKTTTTPFDLKIDWAEFKATSSDVYRLNLSNDFEIDLSTYPSEYLHGIEILIRYNASETAESWFLKAYNWNASSFSDTGFNITVGNQPTQGEWNEYAVTVASNWAGYISDSGVIRLEFFDEGLSTNQTTVGVDFFGARAIIDGARLELKNSSPLSLQIVSLWVTNSTIHQRYSANLFMNSGESATYIRVDVELPQDVFLAKVVTERGNIAVFSED
jgi:Na+-transporting NADH:ubiquinone oxidoreductase subunit NqrC